MNISLMAPLPPAATRPSRPAAPSSPALNPRLLDTGSPPIPEIQAWGAEYRGGEGPLLNLCQAVPAHPPAPGMLEQLSLAAGSPATAGYGPIMGEAALREAYAAELGSVYGGPRRAAEVAITAGCNQAYFVAMMALAGRGDAVLLPTPWYFNHQMTLSMLGIEARALPCRPERGFVPDPEEAAALIDGRVRAIVLVTPNNPTGAILSPEVIARFHALCRERGIWLVLDETYRDFLPEGQDRAHDLLSGEAWPENLVQLYSFSKSFAVPGYRLGAIGAPPALMPELGKVMDCVQICAARAGQVALSWGLGHLAEWRAANRAEMVGRARAVRAAFSRLPGWRLDSLGAYFAYVRHPFGATPAWEVVERLARQHGLMCLPGPAFAGESTHLRIAFANVDGAGIAEMERRLRAATG
ncbi:aminotransferase [Muricoccus pecuniae]|uniref:Aminotransferase n=1 Tax=Muricoccus pecuniae TaxID=693023 RepID=A0A840YJB3_9PROT|nr:aminotransferase [Roseomonas pecuniae]MBB5694084.1 aspartate/methionine/tyrosine aminotransferase [Roseomonas pecuniae]